MYKQFLVLLALSSVIFNSALGNHKAAAPVVVTSPNGKIKLFLESKNGILTYALNFNSLPVIEPSGLGLRMNGKTLGNEAEIGHTTRYSMNTTYPFRGVHSLAINHFNGAKVNIIDKTSRFTLDVRVFNDGVAFRYMVDNSGAAVIEKDLTAFTLPAGSLIWSQSNIKAYEGKYTKRTVADFQKGDMIGPPATIELPANAGYAMITEGGLVNFAGMSLVADSNRVFIANLSGNTHRNGLINSPWRIIEIGSSLNSLVNCDIIANVSEPLDTSLFPKGYQTDWIKPGRSVWSWLALNRSITLENMKRFTDYAAELGFEYNLVDEGWANWKEDNRTCWDMMKELVDYSAKKGVKIWAWKAYPDRKGIPGISDAPARQAFFEQCKKAGIAGLKLDFFDSEEQQVINFYQDALQEAARLHLMLDFHGANKPTGESRTWPNEMSREAIRGMENQPPWAPGNTILPFTRMLAGHADFTPMHFGKRIGEISWAQHIGMMVVFTSPFLCVGADPQSILDNPCKEIIQHIPATWDETIVLPQSKIGELTLFARRNGKTWFLAAMNGENTPKTITVDLSFLNGGQYQLSAVKDDQRQQAGALLEKTIVTKRTRMTIHLNPSGGFVGMIK